MLKEIDRNETKSKGSPKMKRRKSMEINNSSSIQILHTNRLLQTKNKKNKRKWILCATIVYKVYSTKILFYIVIGAILGTFSFFSIFDVFQILQLETISMEFALWYELFTEVISWWTIKPSLMVDIYHVTERNFTFLFVRFIFGKYQMFFTLMTQTYY